MLKGHPSLLRVKLIASAGTILGVLPLVLSGALVVQIGREIPLGAAGLGQAVLVFGITGMVLSVPLGRLVDGIGATVSMRIAALGSAVVAFGLAATARTTLTFVAWLAVAGAFNALNQPAVDRLIVVGVAQARQGAAFGMRQASYPAATLLGGLAVPALALTVGWRWAYFYAGLAALIGAAMVPSLADDVGIRQRPVPLAPPPSSDAPESRGRLGLLPLVVLAAATGLGFAAHSNLSFFLVPSLVESGFREVDAGLLLSLGSICALLARLAAGSLADRRERGHLKMVATMLLGGAGGYLLLTGGPSALIVAGTLLTFSLAWGWAGVFMFAVVRANRAAPGMAAGIIHTGGSLGAAIGPAAFGVIVEFHSYAAAWAGAAAVTLVTAVTILLSQRLVDAQEAHPSHRPLAT